MQRDAQGSDAPRRVLDHGQDVGLGAVEQVGAEEVAGQDRSAWECRNYDQVGHVRRGVGAGAAGLEDLSHGRRRDLDSQVGQLAVDPAVMPNSA
jgi:hypothetical protein